MKSTITLIIAILALVLSTLSITGFFQKKKVAYVRSTDLVYGYLGMKEAQAEYQKKSQMWTMNIDTLQKDYQLGFSRYTAEVSRLNPAQKAERERLLSEQQKNIMTYTKAVNEQAKMEDEKITKGVLNQINSFVEEYGQENGYDIILGTTDSGNLLYGKESMDITDIVLKELNISYKPGQITASNAQ